MTLNTMQQVWIFLVELFALQTYHTFEINREVILDQTIYPAKDRYQIGKVFILELAYAVSFGSELAVVSMLPEYFEETFNLSRQLASLVAATYPLSSPQWGQIRCGFVRFFSTSSVKPEAIIPAGSATKPSPNTVIIPPRILPIAVIGETSP
jgi:hypothetical protein